MSETETGLRIDVERSNRGGVAKVIGPASLVNVDDLSRELTNLSAQRPKLVVFEMSQCLFACSLAIGRFMEFHRELKSHGGVMCFAGLHEMAETSFRKLNLQNVFRLYKTPKEALSARTSS